MDDLRFTISHLQPAKAKWLFCRRGFFLLEDGRESRYQTALFAQQHRVLDVRDGVLELQLAKLILLLVNTGADLFGTKFPDFFRLQHVCLDLISSNTYRLPAVSCAR